jgi:hypothetical protein
MAATQARCFSLMIQQFALRTATYTALRNIGQVKRLDAVYVLTASLVTSIKLDVTHVT